MYAPNLCTVGQPASETFEVVWNGAIDRAWATQRAAAARPEPSPYRRLLVLNASQRLFSATAAKVDRASARTCDRLLVYLLNNPAIDHTGTSVGHALEIPVADAASYLRRHEQRGLLRRTIHRRFGGMRATFRVVPEAI